MISNVITSLVKIIAELPQPWPQYLFAANHSSFNIPPIRWDPGFTTTAATATATTTATTTTKVKGTQKYQMMAFDIILA